MTIIAAVPIYGKNLLQNQKLMTLVCSIEVVGPTKFVQMMIIGRPNAFEWKIFLKGLFLKTVEDKVIVLT